MTKPYWHCTSCGGNFDFGEKCDCGLGLPVPVVSIDEETASTRTCDLLVLGFDMSAISDDFCITVTRSTGDCTEVINTIHGEEAERAYNTLIGSGKG